MRRFVLYLLFLFLPLGGVYRAVRLQVPAAEPGLSDSRRLYAEMGLEGRVGYAAFEQALTGYRRIGEKKKELITLIDYSKPSTEERLFVLDMHARKLLFSSYVSHGRNSGGNYATSFSNEYGSYKSSLGFFLTGGTYQGGNGYSLILDGLEKNINDKARRRAIVMHGAPYCNPVIIRSAGRLGRSLGCPALPPTVSRDIIDAIKDGSLLYIYADNEDYLNRSAVLAEYRASL